MSLSRLPWALTVLACAITAVLLQINNFHGYAAVAVAVGIAAAINLF
jgi:hypothetical protein